MLGLTVNASSCLKSAKLINLGEPNYGITTCHTLETVPIPKKSKFQVNSLSGEEPVQDNVPKFLRDISQSERIFDAHDKYSINTSPVNEHVKWLVYPLESFFWTY